LKTNVGAIELRGLFRAAIRLAIGPEASEAQLVGYEWFFQGWSAKEFREIKAGPLYA
jgi:hypothetical protein